MSFAAGAFLFLPAVDAVARGVRDNGLCEVAMRYLLILLLLTGCKTPEPSAAIGENAKEQIAIAYNNLPKECKSADREREFNLAIKQVDTLVASCEAEKKPLNQRIRYQSLIIAALSTLSILLFLGLIRSRLV